MKELPHFTRPSENFSPLDFTFAMLNKWMKIWSIGADLCLALQTLNFLGPILLLPVSLETNTDKKSQTQKWLNSILYRLCQSSRQKKSNGSIQTELAMRSKHFAGWNSLFVIHHFWLIQPPGPRAEVIRWWVELDWLYNTSGSSSKRWLEKQ